LPQRVERVAREGWGWLFSGMHLALNKWVGRKWLLQVLVGLPWALVRPAPPCEDTWRLGCLA